MVVAGVVIETRTGCAEAVARRLATVAGLEVQQTDGHARIAAVWSAIEGQTLATLSDLLCRSDPDVVAVFPVFVGEDEP